MPGEPASGKALPDARAIASAAAVASVPPSFAAENGVAAK